MKKNPASRNRSVSGPQRLTRSPRRLLPAACSLLFSAGFLAAQPTINSVYPPVLTDRAGDHVAYLATATLSAGGGSLSYAWYQTSNPSTVLSTSSNLVLTAISDANAGTYYVIVTDNNGSTTSGNVTLNVVDSSYLNLVPTNIIVARIGEGSQTLSVKTGNTIYLDQYAPSGAYVNSIQVPDEGTGQNYNTGSVNSSGTSPSLLVEGAGTDSPYEATMALSSANQEYLSFIGYCEAYPYGGSGNVNAGGAAFPRGIGTVNAFGVYSLAYTNEGLYNGGGAVVHSVTTLDGTNFWSTGAAGSVSGVKFFNTTVPAYANGSGIPTVTGTAPNSFVSLGGGRSIQVINGPLVASGFSAVSNLVYAETGATNLNGLYAAVGAPEPGANGSFTMKALLYTGSGGGNNAQPLDFAFSPDNRTIYIADARPFIATNSNLSGGIQCWVANTVGGYSYWYTLQPVPGLTNGAQTLAVDFSANATWGTNVFGAKIYATTYGLTTNSLVQIIDNGPASTPTVLATAGLNEALRGVRFSPTAIPPSILSGPQSQTNFPNNNVTFSVAAVGSAPLFYQWYYGGSPIAGANQSTFTTNNVSFGSSGTYSVVVSNLTTSFVSNSATLLVTAGAPAFVVGVPSYTETAGDHLSLATVTSGSQPLSFQWYEGSTNNPLGGQTGSALSFNSAQTTDSGTYILIVSNSFGTAMSSGTLNITTGLQALSPTNLVVARIGDGVQILSGATGNTLYLDQYATSGAYVSTIQVPDEGAGQGYGTGSSSSSNLPAGSTALIVAGGNIVPLNDAPYEAFLTRSADGHTIDFGGYCEAYPFAGTDVTIGGPNGGIYWRGIGEVNGYGAYSLVYTNTGLYNLGNHEFHSTVTLDQVNYWTAGESGSASIKWVTPAFEPAGGNGIPAVAGSTPTGNNGAGPRVIQIVNGTLVFSDAGASTIGLYACAAGLPTNANSGATLMIAESNSPMDFAISADGATVYIADNGTFASTSSRFGGIQRWDTNTAGSGYLFSYTLGTGTGSTVGARGLTVDFSAHGVWGSGVTGAKLYATTADATGNRLIAITDTGAASEAATLVLAGPTNILSGVKFGPAIVPLSIVSQPQNQAVLTGSTGAATFSVVAAGEGPYTYQWETNGVAIVGATNQTLTVNAYQYPLTGYTVVVSNLTQSVTSSPAASMYFVPAIGLNANGSGWSMNGSLSSGLPHYLSSNVVEMTQSVPGQSSSTFFNDQVYVAGFLATWTYQVVNPGTNMVADGVCFVIQNDSRGASVIGGTGASLGYTGTANSVALGFNLFAGSTNVGAGFNFETNGIIGTNTLPTPVVLSSGDPINVTLRYFNNVATLTLFDTVNSNTFTTATNIDIPAFVGGNSAYVGFTGSDGGTVSTQTVSNFVYAPIFDMSYTRAGSALTLAWPTNVGGYSLQQNTSVKNPVNWVSSPDAISVVGGSNQATITISNSVLFYRLVVP